MYLLVLFVKVFACLLDVGWSWNRSERTRLV